MAKTKINLKAKVTQPRRPNLPKALTGIEGLDIKIGRAHV